MNSVRCGRLSVRRRPIFIYYHLCVVVYLKYWNIQILSYRKNKYMSIRFSQFPFFPDHLRSLSLSDRESRFFELWKVELENSESTTMRWSCERWPSRTRGGTIKKRTSPYSFDLGHNKRILANLISDNFSPKPKITKNTEERVQKVLFLIRETRICEFEGGPVRFKSK